ncbi:MAG: flavin reductase family protein [Pseudomonadota bacterium]
MDFTIVTETRGLNQALFQVTHGLYILTAFDNKPNGQCLDSLMQVTNMPPRVAVGVGKKSLTHEMISATGKFVVNVIDVENPACFDQVKHFGFQTGRKVDKFANYNYEKNEFGIPILPDAKAFYECTVIPELTQDLGTHSLFVATVTKAGTKTAGKPLTYNYYREKMKGE